MKKLIRIVVGVAVVVGALMVWPLALAAGVGALGMLYYLRHQGRVLRPGVRFEYIDPEDGGPKFVVKGPGIPDQGPRQVPHFKVSGPVDMSNPRRTGSNPPPVGGSGQSQPPPPPPPTPFRRVAVKGANVSEAESRRRDTPIPATKLDDAVEHGFGGG